MLSEITRILDTQVHPMGLLVTALIILLVGFLRR